MTLPADTHVHSEWSWDYGSDPSSAGSMRCICQRAVRIGLPAVVFAHIDYAVRSWPAAAAGPFDPRRFEEGFRAAMRAIAASGRALEMNTRRLWPWIPQWWAQEGGRAVSFGSDAHGPDQLAANFPEATAMVESFGFRPGSRAEDFWTR